MIAWRTSPTPAYCGVSSPPAGRCSDERRTPEAHHHFVCRTCNLVVDVDCDVGAPRLTAPHAESFVIDEAEVTYRGICADCVALRPSLEPPLVSG